MWLLRCSDWILLCRYVVARGRFEWFLVCCYVVALFLVVVSVLLCGLSSCQHVAMQLVKCSE